MGDAYEKVVMAENFCKMEISSPCPFLTLAFLLQALVLYKPLSVIVLRPNLNVTKRSNCLFDRSIYNAINSI